MFPRKGKKYLEDQYDNTNQELEIWYPLKEIMIKVHQLLNYWINSERIQVFISGISKQWSVETNG